MLDVAILLVVLLVAIVVGIGVAAWTLANSADHQYPSNTPAFPPPSLSSSAGHMGIQTPSVFPASVIPVQPFPSPHFHLDILSGPASGQRVMLQDEIFLIDRRPGSLLDQDIRVSRRHAILELVEERWYIQDLGSKNGTWLNGRTLVQQRRYPLEPSSILRVGHTEIRFSSSKANPTPSSLAEAQPPLLQPTPERTKSHSPHGSQTIAQYEFDRVPIRGGLAFVYHGRHRRTQQQVGLKLLPDYQNAREDVRRRFEREGGLQLHHDHVVKIFDWGRTRDGPTAGEALYILMEWMEGGNLRTHLTSNPSHYIRHPREAGRVIMEVSQALEHAHHREPRVIHRDIKPENIMFTGEGTVKVVDFGIANVADDLRMTEIGMILGTPAYMSPEQARGLLTIDYRTDIYSTAVVAYEMLTGGKLFSGSALEVIDHHIHTPPDPPRTRNPQLPTTVDDVLLQALSKDPHQRHRQVSEFATDLYRALAG